MKKKFQHSLFIFRRDLRIYDNTGLHHALEQSEKVLPCFIFDPEQITTKNTYKSDNAIQFMIESLKDLELQLMTKNGSLVFIYAPPEQALKKLHQEIQFQAIFCNKDYTPFSKKRDKKILSWCKKNTVDFLSYNDLLLHNPKTIVTRTNKPYKVFTPYYKNAQTQTVKKPYEITQKNFLKIKNKTAFSLTNIEEKIIKTNKEIAVHGGRKNSTKILQSITQWKDYEQTRNIPEYKTTQLSAYIKFGTHSLREIYETIQKKLGKNHPLIRQLYWHDFYTQIADEFPHVFGKAFYEKYNNLKWSTSKKKLEQWCTGETGFPIVDAGMRQLNTTGFMHNRVRMITASFLIKDLHISWLKGEQYFAQKLVDYDPAVNNGNWQWVASTGCDHQPYFRIFNPWLQQKKFDPQCIYIKKWIPELTKLTPKEIHRWYIYYKNNNPRPATYPAPMVDHDQEKKKTIEQYKSA